MFYVNSPNFNVDNFPPILARGLFPIAGKSPVLKPPLASTLSALPCQLAQVFPISMVQILYFPNLTGLENLIKHAFRLLVACRFFSIFRNIPSECQKVWIEIRLFVTTFVICSLVCLFLCSLYCKKNGHRSSSDCSLGCCLICVHCLLS